MPKLIAHLLCLALVAVDLIARTWRTQWMLSGLGYRLRFRELFIQTALGEAASSLTPLRLGGEPARVWAMRRAGVPTRPAIVAIGVELLAMVPVVVAMAVALAWRYAPEWWAAVGPALSSRARTGWPWVAAVVALSLLAWWLARRFAPSAAHAVREEIAAARASAREMPRWPLAASVPATIVSTAARVAILPVLALAIPEHVPLGTVTMGSFALIFGQLFLPTPAGAGAVELGFVGGAAGELGADVGPLLLEWRLYTTGIGIVLGLVLAAVHYGRDAVIGLFRTEATAPDELVEGDVEAEELAGLDDRGSGPTR